MNKIYKENLVELTLSKVERRGLYLEAANSGRTLKDTILLRDEYSPERNIDIIDVYDGKLIILIDEYLYSQLITEFSELNSIHINEAEDKYKEFITGKQYHNGIKNKIGW